MLNRLEDWEPFDLESRAMEANNIDDERYYATAMFVHFTSYHGRVACGELQTQYMDRTFSFAGLDQLLLVMEDVMDFVRTACEKATFPQASFEHRSIKHRKARRTFHEIDNTENIAEFGLRPTKIMAGIAYATITVYYRQHASMKGEVRIAKQKVFFRSGLELIRLLHQALLLGQIEKS